MFNRIKGQLGQQPTEDEIDPMMDEMYPSSYDLEQEPEAIINDPNAPVDVKKVALQKIKDKYLKPKEDNE